MRSVAKEVPTMTKKRRCNAMRCDDDKGKWKMNKQEHLASTTGCLRWFDPKLLVTARSVTALRSAALLLLPPSPAPRLLRFVWLRGDNRGTNRTAGSK